MGEKAPPVDDDQQRIALLEQLNRSFAEVVPHNLALGITIDGLEAGVAIMRLPYSASLVGNPDDGVLHGGAVTSLMDACCGAAVFMGLARPVPIATLDLRIDYLRPAVPARDVVARAECYKVTRNVAFARCVAYHDSPDDPIASAAGTFMLSTAVSRRTEGGKESR